MMCVFRLRLMCAAVINVNPNAQKFVEKLVKFRFMAKISLIDSVKKTFNWLLLKNLLKKFNTTSLIGSSKNSRR